MDETLLRLDDKRAKPFVTVTFDDGYRDTYERTAPVLERLNVPFAIYVPIHAVPRELYAWWLGRRMLFKNQDVVMTDAKNQRFSCFDLKSKIAAVKIVTNWVGECFRLKDAQRQISNPTTFRALSDKYFLNAQELRELAHRPLVTIGAHTISHAALSILSLEDMEAEMSDIRDFLENLIGSEASDFANPYGTAKACGVREFSAAKRLGFEAAATGTNRSIGHGSGKHALPRLNLTGRFWASRRRLNSTGYPKSAPPGFRSPSAERKFL
jgi:peptidoglycan/xylan/chitin deacetylase (PgdA/CDA1 family)